VCGRSLPRLAQWELKSRGNVVLLWCLRFEDGCLSFQEGFSRISEVCSRDLFYRGVE